MAVDFVGRVPSLAEWIADAWVVVVPVIGGVGAPVKYLEALATGAPVISTTDGAPTGADGAVLVSDDPESWVKCLRSLLDGNPPPDSEFQLESFSWASTTSPLLIWLGEL